jgi:hypothetical protein
MNSFFIPVRLCKKRQVFFDVVGCFISPVCKANAFESFARESRELELEGLHTFGGH